MNQPTVLAGGHVTSESKITVVLHDGMVTVTWPAEPLRVGSKQYAEVISRAMRLLANSSTELSRLKAGKR